MRSELIRVDDLSPEERLSYFEAARLAARRRCDHEGHPLEMVTFSSIDPPTLEDKEEEHRSAS